MIPAMANLVALLLFVLKLLAKKNRHRHKTRQGPSCVTHSHCVPATTQFNMTSHGVKRACRMPVEAHTEMYTERPDSLLDLE